MITQGRSRCSAAEPWQTVTYIYKKNELPIATGKVVVKYIDTDGKSILNDVVRTGTVGEDYITEEKNISGYTFQEAHLPLPQAAYHRYHIVQHSSQTSSSFICCFVYTLCKVPN